MATRKRVQSDPNLPLVPFRPSIQAQGGTFPTVGIDVPKNNSAQRIATAINRLPGLTGQFSNINEQRGVEAAEQLNAQELNDVIEGKITPPDGGITGGLGFRKGFAITHAKRWWETKGVKEAGEFENELEEVVDNLIEDGQDIEVARGIIRERINEKKAQITEYFDRNPLSKGINNLILPQVYDKLELGLLKGYKKKVEVYKQNYQIDKINEDFGKFASGLTGMSLKEFTKSISTRLDNIPSLSNDKKKTILRNGIKDLAQLELNNRNYGKVAEIMNEGSSLTMFGDLQSKLMFSDIAKAVRQGEEQRANTSIPRAKRQYMGAHRLLSEKIYQIINSKEDLTAEQVTTTLENPVKNLVKQLYTEHSENNRIIEEYFIMDTIRDSVKNKDQNVLNILKETIQKRVQSGDQDSVANQILNESAQDIANYNAELMQLTPSQRLGIITDGKLIDLHGEILESEEGRYGANAREYFRINTTHNPETYMLVKGLKSFTPTEEVRNAHKLQQTVNNLRKTQEYRAVIPDLNVMMDAIEIEMPKYKEDLLKAMQTPGGMTDLDTFKRLSASTILQELDEKIERGIIKNRKEIESESNKLIELKKKEYEIDIKAKKNYFDAMETRKQNANRGGMSEYVAKYSQDEDAYIETFLADKYFFFTGSKTIPEWEKFEALSEDNLDFAFGLKDSSLRLTPDVLVTNLKDSFENPVKAKGQGSSIEYDAFETMIRTYGMPVWDVANVRKYLERVGADWTEISLFESEKRIEEVGIDFQKVLEKLDRNPLKENFTKDEKVLADLAVFFGLYPDSRPEIVKDVIDAFTAEQKRLFKKQYRF